MNGEALYRKYCQALRANIRHRWVADERRYERVFPVDAPPSWAFAGDDVRETFNTLAKSIAPRRRKS